MTIRLHIERLVLDGIPVAAGQQHLLQAAVQAELARLLAAGGLAPALAAGGAVPRIAAPALNLPAGAGGVDTGSRIAASVHAGIGSARP